MEEQFAPLFATKSVPRPLCKVGEIAAILAEPGVAEETIASQVRRFARESFIYARAERGSHRLFAPVDWAAAKILSVAVTTFGIEDREFLRFISAGLYAPTTLKGVALHALDAALVGTSRGEFWTCRVDVSRHGETGRRRVHVDIYNLDDGPTRADDVYHAPAGSLMFNLAILLPPVVAAAARKAKAN